MSNDEMSNDEMSNDEANNDEANNDEANNDEANNDEMSADEDLFGKIDALLGRRAPDALLEKGLDIEDFPLLTDVIDSVPDALSGEERRLRERRQSEIGQSERRASERRQEGADARPALDAAELTAGLDRWMAGLESRLEEVFIRQQLRLEEALRRAVREEIRKARANEAGADADRDTPPV